MKKLLLVLLLGLVQVQAQVGVLDLADPVFLSPSVDGGGSCATSDAGIGDLISEGGGAASTEHSWTTTTGTPNPSYSSPASGPVGVCDYSIDFNPSGSAAYYTEDLVTADSSVAVKVAFYFDSAITTSGQRLSVLYSGNSSTPGTSVAFDMHIYHNGSAQTLVVNGETIANPISTGWHVLDMRITQNAATVYNLDSAGDVTSSNSTANVAMRYWMLGASRFYNSGRYQVGYLLIDSDGTQFIP